MGQRITAVSFEADGVQVVSVHSSRTGLTVERSLTLQPAEFESFLSQDTATGYLVAVNPADALFETLQIPPTDKTLEAALIQAEAARSHPELVPFSCSYRVLGDLPVEGRVVRKVACCLISHRTIMPVLEPFIRHNKTVSRMLAAPHLLAALVTDEPGSDPEPVLCAHDDGQSKTVFLYENGAVSFSRSFASNDFGWDPLDRQNVSMTLDYCSQALRVRPKRVLILNPTQEEEPDQPPPRLEHLPTPVPLRGIPPETVAAALVPLTLAAYQFPDHYDLLPLDYRAGCLTQRLFSKGFLLFSTIALILAVLIGFRFSSIAAVEEAIKRSRANQGELVEAYQAHQLVLAEQNKLQPLITAMAELQGGTDIPHTLLALNGLKPDTARLTSLVLKREKESVALSLAGTVTSSSYAQAQERFEAYCAALLQIKGMQTTRTNLDPKTQTFTIEAVYKP